MVVVEPFFVPVVVVADGGGAGQALDHFAAGEGVADEAEAAFGVEALAVESDDTGRFLPAMLERMQAKRGDRGCVRMAEDAEDAAFLAQRVAVEVEVLIAGRRIFVVSA